jgi:hypothetical protein
MLADGKFHTLGIVRRPKGSRSPDELYFYIDGVEVPQIDTKVEKRTGSSRADVWFDDMNSTINEMTFGTLDTINKGGADLDEILIWENYAPTSEEMMLLHGAYDQENIWSKSPQLKESPFPSPKQLWSPLPSPVSPHPDAFSFKAVLEKMQPYLLYDFGTVGVGSPKLKNEGSFTQNYDLKPTAALQGVQPSPVLEHSPRRLGIQLEQGQGADGSRSPSRFVRFPQSPPTAYYRNFELDSPTLNQSPLQLKNVSPNHGSMVFVFRIAPRSPEGAFGYLASYEGTGTADGWHMQYNSSVLTTTLRIEWYTSTSSSGDMAITPPTSAPRLDDNRWHMLSISKAHAYPQNSPLTRNADVLECYLDGERVTYTNDNSRLSYWWDNLVFTPEDRGFAIGARGLNSSNAKRIQSGIGVDWQYFGLLPLAIDWRRAKWMWEQFTLGDISPRPSPFGSPIGSPKPSPISPVLRRVSPLSPFPSPISPLWSPKSPQGSPIEASPTPASFLDTQALADLALEYQFNDPISPRVIANTGDLGAKFDLNAVANQQSPATYSFIHGGNLGDSPTNAVRFPQSPAHHILYRTIDASPSSAIVFEMDRGCITVAARIPTGYTPNASYGANMFVLHVGSVEYFVCRVQNSGIVEGYWRPRSSSSYERRMRTEVDMRDNEWHVYHFNFRYASVYGGIESPNYGRLYVDGVYQQGTNVIDSLGRNEWLQNIEPINTIMVGGWEWDAVPPDGNQNYGFYGDIDYVSVAREPMKQVWVEGAARAYHRGRNSPKTSPHTSPSSPVPSPLSPVQSPISPTPI